MHVSESSDKLSNSSKKKILQTTIFMADSLHIFENELLLGKNHCMAIADGIARDESNFSRKGTVDQLGRSCFFS